MRSSPAPPTTPKLPLSRYQERIIEFVREGNGHGVVHATAGAGKTSTLVEVAGQLDERCRACFLAFGREAAAELARRLPPRVTASTVHSLGRSTLDAALRERGKRLRRVEQGKYRRLLRDRLRELQRSVTLGAEELAQLEEYIASLLDLARLHLWNPDDRDALARIADRHTIVPPEDYLLPLAHDALRRVLERGSHQAIDLGICDFTDMLCLPVTLQLEPPRFDFVCVDESQDYSGAALAFTRRLVDSGAGGRLLFVGDPRQSIYGFAGADSDAMGRIVRETGATVLPLSITYRCPRSHVALARLLAPEIEAGPEATEGRVYWISDAVLEHWAREGDMIICRANAPLVKACLRLVRAGRRAFVRGRDLKRQLLELSERALGTDEEEVAARLARFTASEEARIRRGARERSRFEPLLEAKRDLIACLRFLAVDPTSGRGLEVREVRGRIEETFDEREGALVLSTIHRAKGLESDRILILYPELMPAPYARTYHSLRGEAAVQFVALTRARRDLVFVSESRDLGEKGGRTGPSIGPPGKAPGVPHPAVPAAEHPHAAPHDSDQDEIGGQGPGTWLEVLALARLLARGRG